MSGIIVGPGSPNPTTGDIAAINLVQKVLVTTGTVDQNEISFAWPQAPTPGNLLIIVASMPVVTDCFSIEAPGWSSPPAFMHAGWPSQWQGTVLWKVADASESSVTVAIGIWNVSDEGVWNFVPSPEGHPGAVGLVAMEWNGLSAPDQQAFNPGGIALAQNTIGTGATPETTDPNELVIAWVEIDPENTVTSWALSNGAPMASAFGTVHYRDVSTGASGIQQCYFDVATAVVGALGAFGATATFAASGVIPDAYILTFKSNGKPLNAQDGTVYANSTTGAMYGPYKKALSSSGKQWPVITDGGGGAPQVQSDWDATTGLGVILNKPTIPAAQVQSDWDATSGVAAIANKPSIPSGYTLPAATAAALGGVKATVNPGSQFVDGINSDGSLHFDTPSGGGGSGNVPAGGTTGQILKKNTDADYDTGWENAPSGGGAPPPSYLGPGGYGDRRGLITVTNVGAPWVNNENTLVGPLTNNVGYFSGGAVAGYFQFDFGVSVVIDEMIINMQMNTNEGVWKWQGSADGTTFVDIGTSFTISANGQHVTEINGTTTSYRYYRLTGVSGTTNSAPYMGGICFRITFG